VATAAGGGSVVRSNDLGTGKVKHRGETVLDTKQAAVYMLEQGRLTSVGTLVVEKVGGVNRLQSLYG
jgi:hypothetical protein